MDRSRFLSILLLSLLLALCFSHGFGRRMRMVETIDPRHGDSASTLQLKENGGKWRIMTMETMDYSDPEPNTNTKGGYVSPPPPNHG